MRSRVGVIEEDFERRPERGQVFPRTIGVEVIHDDDFIQQAVRFSEASPGIFW